MLTKRKKILKRIISMLTAVALILTEVHFGWISSILFGDSIAMTVYAAPSYDSTTHTVTIESAQDLVDYSGLYYTEAGHENDTIFINWTSTGVLNEFRSIGDDSKPFNGKILFYSTAPKTFLTSVPIFGTVYDSVQIVQQSGDTEAATNIIIEKTAMNENEPLFAKKVIHDTELNISSADTAPGWNVDTAIYNDGQSEWARSHSGFIEEIGDGAMVSITIRDNAKTADENVAIKNDADVGMICGKLGASAQLKASYSGTNVNYTIESSAGHAGGFVGSMGSGSSFELTVDSNPQTVQAAFVKTTASEKYAGGLVGYNAGGEVTLHTTGAYQVNQMISGIAGEGGLYGYYEVPSGDTLSFDVSDYDINCLLNSTTAATGSAGGLFGVLKNNGTVSIDGGSGRTTITSDLNTIGTDSSYKESAQYGGIIGQYLTGNVLTNTISISNIDVDANNTKGAVTYGGCIADSADLAYIEFDNITVASTGHGGSGVRFAGLINSAKYSYVYAKNITVGSSTDIIQEYNGAGLIDDLENGVLRMSDSIILTNGRPKPSASNGQIVASRNNALIYADAGWTFARSNASVDNVGSWGDVLVFNTGSQASGGDLVKANVLTENANHTITIGNPTTANVIADEEDFAKISILSQIDIGSATSKNRILSGTSIAAGTAFSLSNAASIDLRGTGLKGITRDNGTTRTTYSGATFAGNNGTVKLDVKNVGDKPIYFHKLNGLFGKVNGTTFSNLTMDGSMSITAKQDGIYAGSFAAEASGALSLNSCNTASTLAVTINGDKNGNAGRAIGVADSSITGITVSEGTYAGTLTGSNTNDGYRLGGVIGYINYTSNTAASWTFEDITVSGEISNTSSKIQKIGGLVASIDGSNTDGKSLRELTIDNVTISNLTISGNVKDKCSMGGLLGYYWAETNVDLHSLTVNGTTNITMTSTGSPAQHGAGLVYAASGKWDIGTLSYSAIKLNIPQAASFGYIVNKGYTKEDNQLRKGIYLEIDPSTYTINLDSGSSIPASLAYDEICAYSATEASKIMDNGQGIISIITSGAPKTETTATNSLTYVAKTTKGQTLTNGNTRYYYNLNAVDDSAGDLSSDPAKLMRWGLYQYACHNIKAYFPDPYDGTISGTNFSMKNYSWYPVSINSAVSVSGTFEFFNNEFENCEALKTNTKLSSLASTQHYMMQNGLFYDVSSNVAIGNIVLKGNIGAVGTSGTGALIYGTIRGSDTNPVVISSVNGSISLDGIQVHNFSTKSPSYAPLLINASTGYVTLDIYHVSNTNNSTYAVPAGKEVATSLIGKLGSSSAKFLNVTFSDIKLDGRKQTGRCTSSGQIGTVTASSNTSIYFTSKSIFSRATLLESFMYDSDSSGVYNFTYNEDWGTGTPRKVTYGKELGYVNATSGSTNANNNQFPGLELQYSGSGNYVAYKLNGSNPYTSQNNTISNEFLSYFRPYVADVDKSSKKFQLAVNHRAITLTGCGTYNDPYIIEEGTQLEGVSRILRGNANNGDTLCLPTSDGTTVAIGATWCHDKATPDHIKFTYDGTNFSPVSGASQSTDDVRKHLAGAYYLIQPKNDATSITISNNTDFNGLGSTTADTMFRGVIDGNNKTIINQTDFPLIATSNGSVVKDLTVTIDKTTIAKTGSQSTFPTATAYGAIIGQIHGGDNIIDKVTVNFGSSVISLNGDKAQLIPTGGYVGVVLNGGLIFRNMNSVAATSKLAAANVTTNQTAKVVTDMTATTSTHETTNDLWLYVNPYVGRVINGYAVNIASAYHDRDSAQTLQNGTKHYSITDIDPSEGNFTVSGSTITIPNAQSFFIISLIVNSGMGMKTAANATSVTSPLGYYNGYCTTRHALYSEIGEDTSTDYTSLASKDVFWQTATTAQKQIDTPYIVENYTPGSDSDNYVAKTLGGSSSAWSINLKSGVTYNLPDGYKGIGNIFNNNDALRLSVSGFDGKGCTIDQNTRYVNYKSDFEKQYYPKQGPGNNGTYGSKPDLGLGLFNCQSNSATYQNFTLTGKVRSDVVDKDSGTHIDYTDSNVFNTYVLSTGMLFGTFAKNGTCTLTIKNVILSNIDVRGAKYSGGYVGLGPMDKTNNITITQEASYNKTSTGVTVHGVTGAGGMIGRWYQGKPTINYNGKKFQITGIYSDINSDSNSVLYGIGGLIGVCRSGGGKADLSETAGDGTITDIVIEPSSSNSKAVVECTVIGKGINAGGLMGTLNRCSPNISNCQINNISVKSNGSDTYVGGVVGYVTTFCKVIVNDVKVYTSDSLQATISGNGYCGGILGLSPCLSGDGTFEFTLLDSSIEGYTISGNTVGGIVGERNSWRTSSKYSYEPSGTNHNDGFDMRIENFEITKCTITGTGTDSIAGGLIGSVVTPIKGYNIHAKDLTVTGTTAGYVVGTMVDSDKGLIKFVAFSRQETRDNETMLATIVGAHTTYEYGDGGYIVFSDYLGTKTNTTVSTVNATSNISAFKSPYVHINPSVTFEGSVVLTGDGVSTLTNVTGGKASAVIKKINDDVQDDKPNYINAAAGYDSIDTSAFKANMQELYNSYITRQSTFKIEADDKLEGVSGYDFPVLILDISNATMARNYINNYIHLLTNTPSSGVFSNFANDYAGVYRVVLTRYQYDAGEGELVEQTTGYDSFIKEDGKFYMDGSHTDTECENAQFTLMDIQFFDPSDPTKVAYHLYIPVYCRKLLEYDFRINLESGTNYDRTTSVSSIRPLNEENVLIENIGTPVTMEFVYTYKRNLQEWKNALEGGDSLIVPYSPRVLQFQNNTFAAAGQTPNSFPSGTAMVLVDVNRKGKAYFLDSLTSTAFSAPDPSNNSYLNLNQFTATDGAGFVPVTFCDLMIVTAVEDPDGKFVSVTTAGGTGTVKINSGSTAVGRELRLYDDFTDADRGYTRYNVNLAFPDGVTELSERYFLTIYTPSNQSANQVYHYVIGSKASLNETSGQFPTKVTSVNQRSNLYIGDIYSNHVYIESLSDPQMITAESNTITADLKAEIELTTAGRTNVFEVLNKANLYQSFLIKLNKFNNNATPAKSEIGILAENIQVTPSDGKIGYDGGLEDATFTWSGNSNYIEVKSGQNLQTYLISNTTNNRVTVIKTKVTLTFDGSEESTDIPDQFYGQPEDSERGTLVYAYSNISPVDAQTAYSNATAKDESSTKIYYTSEDQGAALTYDAVTVPNKGTLQQLGINRRDEEEPSVSLIKTQGNYGIAKCKTAASECQYVKCRITLSRKQDDATYTTTPLVLSDYISNIKFGNTTVTPTAGATEYYFIFDKVHLTLENDIYCIPIEVTVISGDAFENGTDTAGNKRVYSNYKITLEVCMQEDDLVASEAKPGTSVSDYLIYTHAKIYTERIDPTEGGGGGEEP